MRLHVDHEFQEKVLEAVAEGYLRSGGETELLADTIGPVVGAAHIALDEVSGRGLNTNPIAVQKQQVYSLIIRNKLWQRLSFTS